MGYPASSEVCSTRPFSATVANINKIVRARAFDNLAMEESCNNLNLPMPIRRQHLSPARCFRSHDVTLEGHSRPKGYSPVSSLDANSFSYTVVADSYAPKTIQQGGHPGKGRTTLSRQMQCDETTRATTAEGGGGRVGRYATPFLEYTRNYYRKYNSDDYHVFDGAFSGVDLRET